MNTSTNFIKGIQKHTYICTVKPEYFKGVKFHKIYKLFFFSAGAKRPCDTLFIQFSIYDHIVINFAKIVVKCPYETISLVTF